MLKPEQIRIIGDIDNLNCNLMVSMVYANWTDTEIDAEFILPIDQDVIVNGLSIKKQHDIIETKIMKREEAAEEHKIAKEQGEKSVLAIRDNSRHYQQDRIRVHVGKIDMLEEIEVMIETTVPLRVKDGKYFFVLPEIFAP